MLFALLVSLAGSAKSLVFTLSDGTTVTYALTRTEEVKMVVQDSIVYVSTDQYQFSDIVSWRISRETPSAIETPTTETNRSGDVITFGKTGRISVFSQNGRRVATAEGESIDLSTLPRGIYIVKSGDSSLKVMKR